MAEEGPAPAQGDTDRRSLQDAVQPAGGPLSQHPIQPTEGPLSPLLSAHAPSTPLSPGVLGAPHVHFQTSSPPSLDSSSSSSSEDEAPVVEARPPDGGWGWVVVFASFMVNLIADGITFSFGIFYQHFLEYFGEGKARTAWIGGIFMAMPLLSGPIASFLTDRYGCRRVTVFGSVLAALGFVISAFVDNIDTLLLTFGIMAGFGLSLCYVAAVVIVAYYFEKKRSLATGVSVCGSGIGTFLFAPLTHYLLEEYGWRGTTLLMAGFFLNMAVCGLLMRDLPWTATMIEAKARDRRRSRERRRRRCEWSDGEWSDSRSSAAGTAAAGADAAAPAAVHFSSLIDLPTYARGHAQHHAHHAHHAHHSAHHHALSMLAPSRSFSDQALSTKMNGDTPVWANREVTASAEHPAPAASHTGASLRRGAPGAGAGAPMARAAYLQGVRVHRRSLTYRGAMLNISRYRLRASSCPNIFRNSMTTIAKEKVQWWGGAVELWDLVVRVLDCSHLTSAPFCLFAFSNFLLYTWYDVPYVYLGELALQRGHSEKDCSLLIAVIGISNMFGELIIGWVGDWEGVSACGVYAVCMCLCGLVSALAPLPSLASLPALASLSALFGFTIAANYSLTSVILVHLISIDNFTSAYGLLLLIQGIANLVGPPLAGWLCDELGSCEVSFYLSGAFIALSGLVLCAGGAAGLLRRAARSCCPGPCCARSCCAGPCCGQLCCAGSCCGCECCESDDAISTPASVKHNGHLITDHV